jgi:hypothetical protein
MIFISGCDRAGEDRQTTTVLSYRGDPDNFTPGGFPRHVYPVLNCDYEIKLEPPFEVSEDGWGHADIRVPLTLLEDPSVKDIAAGGVDDQSRVSYAFASLYGGAGLKESFAPTLEPPRPLASAKSTLGTQETLKEDGTRGETRYLGKLPDGRETALLCTATDWPNPTCKAELPVGSYGRRYLIIFPPKAIGKLGQMVEIGDELFSDAAARCKPQ